MSFYGSFTTSKAAAVPTRQSALSEYGPRGSGFDHRVYAHSATPSVAAVRATQSQPVHTPRTLDRQTTKVSHRPERCVTAAQVSSLSTGGGCLVLDGEEVSVVSMLGRVLAVGASRTAPGQEGKGTVSTTLLLSDTSGLFVAQQWDTAARSPTPAVGVFVNVAGRLVAPSSSTISIEFDAMPAAAQHWRIVGQISLVEDSNMIVYHALNTILTSLRLLHGDAPASSPMNMSRSQSTRGVVSAPPVPMSLLPTTASMPTTVVTYPTMPLRPAEALARAPPAHPTAVRHPTDAITTVLRKASDSDAGLSRTAITDGAALLLKKHLGGTFDDMRRVVARQLHELIDDGILVCTGEDDHFAVAFDY